MTDTPALLMLIVDHDPAHHYEDLELLASDAEETGSRLEDFTTEEVTEELVAQVRQAAQARVDHIDAMCRLLGEDPYDEADHV